MQLVNNLNNGKSSQGIVGTMVMAMRHPKENLAT
jgi:hypothetical protein